MGTRPRYGSLLLLIGLVLTSSPAPASSLSVTVNDVECVYEYVLYEGDTVSGNFVVVDHDIFWSSDHPGIDFIVSIIACPFRFFFSFFGGFKMFERCIEISCLKSIFPFLLPLRLGICSCLI